MLYITQFTIYQETAVVYYGQTYAGLEVKRTLDGHIAWAFQSEASEHWEREGVRFLWLRSLMFAPSVGVLHPECRTLVDGQAWTLSSRLIDGLIVDVYYHDVWVHVELPLIDSSQLDEPWRTFRQDHLAKHYRRINKR